MLHQNFKRFILHLYPCGLTAFYIFQWIITLVIYSVAPLSGHSVQHMQAGFCIIFYTIPSFFEYFNAFWHKMFWNHLELSPRENWKPFLQGAKRLQGLEPKGTTVPKPSQWTHTRMACSHLSSTVSPCGHTPHPAWHLTPVTGPIPTPTPHVPMANELLTSQTPREGEALSCLSSVRSRSKVHKGQLSRECDWGLVERCTPSPGRMMSRSQTAGWKIAYGSVTTVGSHVVRGLSHHCDTPGTQGWWHLSFAYRSCRREDSHVDLTEGGTHQRALTWG